MFPIAEVQITLCTKEWVCPAGTYKSTSSCVKCAAGEYRTSDDPENTCIKCDAGFIEQGDARDSRCFTECPQGKYCLAGSFEGSARVIDCPAGRYCPKGSASDSKKCHAGFVCYKNSIDGQGRDKADSDVRKCEAGYYCAAGSRSTKQSLCSAGYYCPKGTATQQKCSTDAKKRFSKYCLTGYAKPVDIADGYRGTGWSSSRKTFSGAPVKCAPGTYCNKNTIQTSSNAASGMPESNKCAKGRTGWTSGNKYDTCDAECPEGYFCDEGTKLRWPANTDALKKSWAKIACGASKDDVKNKRYANTYAATVYCPAGTTSIKTASSEYYTTGPADSSGTILNCRSTPGKKCSDGTKCCWRASHGHDDDNYIKLRVGQKKCEANYVCVNGVRAPTLEFVHFKDSNSDGDVDTDATDSCGGETWKTTSAVVATPNDADLTSVKSEGIGTNYQWHYLDTRQQKISLKIDTRIPVTVKSDDTSFNPPIYTVVDEVSGSTHWLGNPNAAQNAADLGAIRLQDGKAIKYPTKGGSTTRVLTITSKREFKNAAGIYIKTLKPCKVTVTLRNSNDRPTVPTGQVRSIEEWSKQDMLVQTPIEAEDLDQGQGFIFTLLKTTRGDAARNGAMLPVKNAELTGNNLPFVVGRCSGIIKVKKDILRYDYDTVLDSSIKSGLRQYILRIHVEDKDTDDQDFENGSPIGQSGGTGTCNYAANAGTSSDRSGYCQKRSEEATITVDILNRNDAPEAKETTKNNDFTIGENAAVNTKLSVGGGGRDKGGTTWTGNKNGRIYFTDPDLEDTHTFRIISLDDHDAFALDSKTGQLSVKKSLNFEKKETYRIKVSITDSGGWRNIPKIVETWVTITVLDQNDAPSCKNSKKGEVDEELAIGEVVISDLGGEDVDAIAANKFTGFKFNDGNTITSADGDFTLAESGGKWQMKTAKKLNFEALDTDTDGEYKKTYEIYAIDGQNAKSNIMKVTVEVNDVNEIPVNFVDYTIHVDENEKDAKVCLNSDSAKCNPDEVIGGSGAAAVLDLDQDQSLKFSFHADSLHTDLFKIDEDSGLIKTKDALDKESTASYTLKVTGKDNGKPQQEKTVDVTVTVRDVDEAPNIKDSMEKDLTLGERATKNFEVFDTGANSEDIDVGDTAIKYELQAGNDDGYFAIDENTGKVTVAVEQFTLDYEDNAEFELTVRTVDASDSSLYTDENIKVTLTDENEPPEVDEDEDDDGKATGAVARTVTEEKQAGTKVGNKLTCTDPDESDSADDGGCTSTCSIQTSGHLKADWNSGSEKWELGTGVWSSGDVFELDNMQLKVATDKTVPTYKGDDDETKALFVRVECTDEGGLTSVSQDVLIEIEEYNEEPEIDSVDFDLFENTPKGTKVGTKIVARDDEVELGTQTLSFSITKGNKDGYFKIDSNTGQISVDKDNLDYEDKEVDGEALFTLTITVEDDDEKNPKAADAEVKINIIDVNEPPDVYEKWEFSIDENKEVGFKIGDPVFEDSDGKRRDLDPDIDQDADIVVDKFTSGNDDGLFAISKESQITVAKAEFDFETKSAYKLNLRVIEPASSVESVDYRGTQFKTRKGHICQAWKDQSPHKHDYTPDEYPDAGLEEVTVTVDGAEKKYTIKQGVCRDPSNRGDPWCYTTSSDKEWDYCDIALTAEIELTINIKDINENPTLELPKAELTIDEDADTDENVGKPMVGEDEDEKDTIEYFLVTDKDAGGRFKIDKSSGQIKVAKSDAFDFENQRGIDGDGVEHEITVEVKDNNGNKAEKVATIRVIDVNENPTVDDLTVSVSEDLAEKKIFGTLAVADQDKDDDHTCKITDGNDDSAFALDSASHEFSINNASALDFEGGKGTYTVSVECTDDGGLDGTAQVKITLTDSNENPSVKEMKLNVEENAPSELQLAKGATVTIEDEDNKGDVVDHTLAIVGGDPGSMFKLEGRAIKVGNRGWLYKIDEDSDEYKTPRMVTKQTDNGGHVTCPSGEVISFGFKQQFSFNGGNNFANEVVMVGASHIKESVGKLNKKMTDGAFRQLTL